MAGVNTPERALQANVLAAAKMQGWLCYHTWDSRRSEAGFPDLLCVRDGAIVAIELKSATGKVTPEQQFWIDDLAEVPGVRFAGVIRPADWYAGALDGALRRP